MAIKIFNKYSPRANAPDANYTYGSIKNETVAGANDGTPLDQDWANDYEGFTQALLLKANIVPSGNADTVNESDRMNALNKIIDEATTSLDIIYPIGSTKEFYSAVDPNPNALTGYSAFTWVRVANGITFITDDKSKMSTTEGNQLPVGGTTESTPLTIAQIPAHEHNLTASVISGGGQPFGSGGSSTIDNRNIGTGSTGGSQGHTHDLNLQTVYFSKWVRTA